MELGLTLRVSPGVIIRIIVIITVVVVGGSVWTY